MSNQNREYGKRKELNVASGVMYRILGKNTDIVVFVDTLPYIDNHAMTYDEVVRVEFENLDYKDLKILAYKTCIYEEEDGNYIKRTYLVDCPDISSGVLRIEILSKSNEFDSLVRAIVKEIQVKTIEEW